MDHAIGCVRVLVHLPGVVREVILNEVLYVPEASANLLSVRAASKHGLRVKLDEGKVEIRKKNYATLRSRMVHW